MKNGRGIGHGPILPIGAGDSDYLDAQTGCGREDATPQIPRVYEGMAPVLEAARCGEAAFLTEVREARRAEATVCLAAGYQPITDIPSDAGLFAGENFFATEIATSCDQGANRQVFAAQFGYRLVAGIPSDPCADPFDSPALSISAWSSWKRPQ